MKNPKISVFGLGYVGSVAAACFAEKGCKVVGCDVSQAKVDQINTGKAPIGEPGLEALLGKVKGTGRLSATVDASSAVFDSEISIVCVGTPSTPSGGLDLQYVEGVSREIAEAITRKGGAHTVVYRSTMLPGSTRRISDLYFGGLKEVEVFFYPEFLRQGSALDDFRNPSLSAIGCMDGESDLIFLDGLLEGDVEVMSLEEAELLKYGCNAFHATKVAFANEIGRIGKALGLDSARVMETLCQDERLNISSYYLRPGTPFGGSCLPKDVRALTQQSRVLGVSAPLIESLMDSNQRHLESLLSLVEGAHSRDILIIGLAFKAGTDDLRGSAILELAMALLLRGFSVRIFDPDVKARNLIGANKTFADWRLPNLESLLVPDLNAIDPTGDALTVVISKPCLDEAELARLLDGNEDHHVIDVNGLAWLSGIASSHEGLCW